MPLEEDVEEMEPESSPGSDLDEGQKPEGDKATDAESSAATDEAEGKETLDIVRDAVAKKPEATADSSTAGEEDGNDADDAPPKRPDDENYSDVPFHKHPRFQHLLREKKMAEKDAGLYRKVQTFLDTSGVSSEEAANAITVAALSKSNPEKAWEMLEPLMKQLAQAIGRVLPEDLAKRVQAGEITKEVAKELARERGKVKAVETGRTFEQQQAERRAAQDVQTSLHNAANEWETNRRQRDSNFDAKLVPLQKEIAYLQATEGKPTTPEGVKDQLKRAYKAVNDAIQPAAALQPTNRRPAIKPVTGSQTGRSSASAKPGSSMDIVNSVLTKHGLNGR